MSKINSNVIPLLELQMSITHTIDMYILSIFKHSHIKQTTNLLEPGFN